MTDEVITYNQMWKNHCNKVYKDHHEKWVSIEDLGRLQENRDKTYNELDTMVREQNRKRGIVPAQRSLKEDLLAYHIATTTKLPRNIVELCYEYALDVAFPDDLADLNEEMTNRITFAEAIFKEVEGGKHD